MALLLAALALAAETSPAAPPRALATVSVLVGTAEAKTAAAADFAPLAQGAGLDADTWIRTPAGAGLILEFADGSEIRISENTEFHLTQQRGCLLKVGAAYLIVKPGAPYEAETKFARFSFPGAILSLAFVNRDPKSVEYRTVSRTETLLHVFEGAVRVVGRKDKQTVSGGWMCNLVDAQLNTPDPNPNFALVTAWVTPLLVARGKETPEIPMRIELLYNDLGSPAHNDRCEAGLRLLGKWAAPLLAGALQQPSPQAELPRRRAAARVLGDVAPPPVASGLVPLLKDGDADVRGAAARGLKRLAGQDLGFDEAYWKGPDCARGAAAWEAHLKKSPLK
jgi:hypothetical protein